MRRVGGILFQRYSNEMIDVRVIYSKTGEQMKRFLFLLLLGLLVGCQKKEVGIRLPVSDALYRTWRLTQMSYDGQAVDHEQYITVVTFPRDGSFRGSLPKDNRWCCTPTAFEGTDAAIRFVWDTSNPSCAVINCRLSPLRANVDWQIMTLTDEQLVLTGGKTTLTYEPVP